MSIYLTLDVIKSVAVLLSYVTFLACLNEPFAMSIASVHTYLGWAPNSDDVF